MSATDTGTGTGAPRLGDPDTFVDGVPHEAIAELRRTTPVSWQEMDGDEPGFWAVLRHADVVAVARDLATYSAERGGVVLEDLEPESLQMMRGMLLAMDPTWRPPDGASPKLSHAELSGARWGNVRLPRVMLADASLRLERLVRATGLHRIIPLSRQLMPLPVILPA